MTIRESAEDYLEAMLMMRERHGYIRSVDVSEQLGVTKPSVSYAVKRLRENGYLLMDADGRITLTDAREDACKIEHDICDETFSAIRALVKKRV